MFANDAVGRHRSLDQITDPVASRQNAFACFFLSAMCAMECRLGGPLSGGMGACINRWQDWQNIKNLGVTTSLKKLLGVVCQERL